MEDIAVSDMLEMQRKLYPAKHNSNMHRWD